MMIVLKHVLLYNACIYLGELFQTGTTLNPRTNEVIWQKINDFSSIPCNLPANTRKIGEQCLIFSAIP